MDKHAVPKFTDGIIQWTGMLQLYAENVQIASLTPKLTRERALWSVLVERTKSSPGYAQN